jgi:hypothetical protein
MAASLDTLPDALDIRLDGNQGSGLEVGRKPGHLGVARQIDRLLTAQSGLGDKGCLRGDHLCELPDSRPARCPVVSGQCLRDLISIDPSAVELQLRISRRLAESVGAAQDG